MELRERIIVALDTRDGAEALRLGERLRGHVTHLKVGSTLFLSEGPRVVTDLRGLGFDVFVDLKLHDIPHQVGGAVAALVELGAWMLTVHASGGAAMVSAAAEAARVTAAKLEVPRPLVIAVTVLTSLDHAALSQVGVPDAPDAQVERLASLAVSSGADGVVCSPRETAQLRRLLGPDAVIVTPGVRPDGAATGDQARVSTPAQASSAGASYLVIGRPVTEADDPVAALDRIVVEGRA